MVFLQRCQGKEEGKAGIEEVAPELVAGWGSMFSHSKDPPKPTLAQLRKRSASAKRRKSEKAGSSRSAK